jgi:DNA-binding MarR family transcriptional regulator
MPKKKQLALVDELRPRLLRISQALRRETKLLPITRAQTAVLNLLIMGKPMRLSDLARAEAVTLPTMTQVINRMESAGWVTRMSRPGTYNNLIDITDDGRQVAAQSVHMRNEALLKRLRQLSPEECESLRSLLPIIDKMFAREPWIFDPTEDGQPKA